MYTQLIQYFVYIKFIMYSKRDDFLALCFSNKWFKIQWRSVIYWKNVRNLHSYIASQVICHPVKIYTRRSSIFLIFTRSRINFFCLWTFQPQNVIDLLLVKIKVCIFFFCLFVCLFVFCRQMIWRWKSNIFLHNSNKSHFLVISQIICLPEKM